MLLSFLLTVYLAASSALYSSDSNVIELKSSNFEKLVLNSDEVWLVEFFAPWCGHCKNFAPVYKEAAWLLKGIVKVGAINGDENQELCGRYRVSSFPIVKIFANDKNKPTDYRGERSARGLAEAAMAAVNAKVNARLGGKGGGSEKDVIELTDQNFETLVLSSDDMWLVEFYAPWCQHCKDFAPQWIKAATSLKGKVKVGAMDATVNTETAAAFGVGKYPTIKYFLPGPKDASSAPDYDGPYNGLSIANWALDKLAESIQPPKLEQITNEETFRKACEEKPLCIISILPQILDCQSECRNAYLETLTTVAAKHKQKLWGWGWAEAGAQPDLERALDIGGFGYPAMAVVNLKKSRFSVLRGPFSTTGIYEFLRDVYYGRGSVGHLEGVELSKVIVESALWDGKDGEMPIEEDIDLSDVDLDEKDEL